MIGTLITFIFLCIIFGLVFYALTFLSIAPPFMNLIKVALILIFILLLIYFFLPLTGVHSSFTSRC